MLRMRQTVSLGGLILVALLNAEAQDVPPEAYRTRQSQCRHSAPSGRPLEVSHRVVPTKITGYTAEKVLFYSASGSGLSGGDIFVCSEYGRVEVMDSDDDQVRLQIRMEGFGEGAQEPGRAAARVIDETEMHVHMTAENNRLQVSVWHSTLGFTSPGAQPAWVSVRLHVPDRGAYRVRTEAFHGLVAIRRLTLSHATMRGNVGEKFKGISGFIFASELDNVTLAGDVDIDNLVGLPGVRASISGQMAAIAAPIYVKARVAATSRLTAVTGSEIKIAIQPTANLGVRALGESNTGVVRVGIDGAVAGDSSTTPEFRVRRQAASSNYSSQSVQLDVRARSATGNVWISSVPAAPLRR
jgi:hypothetical protein